MDEINASLGRRIFALRAAKGLSQDKLAEKAGMSVKHLGKVERGVANASIKCLAEIAEALDMPVRDMLDIEHEQDREKLLAELMVAIPKLPMKELQIVYRLMKVLAER
ncbi:MAG: helix-turn-helix domain-containing protein [Deltaproteobacteria bacterium]|jgi:transcriptional regulator with XRE-family HTH domain|nr:helix-turn-helix domain-containing protein [Deltaproteobacteria bacterium]